MGLDLFVCGEFLSIKKQSRKNCSSQVVRFLFGPKIWKVASIIDHFPDHLPSTNRVQGHQSDSLMNLLFKSKKPIKYNLYDTMQNQAAFLSP